MGASRNLVLENIDDVVEQLAAFVDVGVEPLVESLLALEAGL